LPKIVGVSFAREITVNSDVMFSPAGRYELATQTWTSQQPLTTSWSLKWKGLQNILLITELPRIMT